MTIGAITGGLIIKIGIRKAIFISIAIGFSGISITMILKFWVLLVGRFLFGLSVGLFSSIIPKYVE